MLRSEGPSEYRKALVAAGAAVGVGLIAYRLWSRRRPASDGSGSRGTTETGTPPAHRPLQKVVEERVTETQASASLTQEPSTDKTELYTAKFGKESISVDTDSNGADILSMSGTYVKVSPSVSPVGFEEIGASYVEPMSMPSTPPLLAEPITRLNEPNLAADYSMTSSSLSFIALSTEQPEEQLPHGGSSERTFDSHTSGTVGDVSVTEKNDIVVIETSFERSPQNGSEDVEAEVAAAVSATDVVEREEEEEEQQEQEEEEEEEEDGEQLEQSDTTETEPAVDSADQGVDVTDDASEE